MLVDMPQSSEVSAAFGKVFQKRGYIVICTKPGRQYELGTRLRNLWGYSTRRKFVVSAFTTRRDYEAQMTMMAEDNKSWKRRNDRFPKGSTYYRVIPEGLLKSRARPTLKEGEKV